MDEYIVYSLIVCSAIVSITCCIVVIWRIVRASKLTPLRLLALQILHLSIADLLNCVFVIPQQVFQLVRPRLVLGSLLIPVCAGLYTTFSTFFAVSALVELNISVTVLASVFKLERVIAVLERSLAWTWFVGLLLSVLGLIVDLQTHAITSETACHQEYDDLVYPTYISVVIISCVICHICCVVRATKIAGGKLQRDLFIRSQLYVGTAIVSFTPIQLLALGVIPHELGWELVANCLANLNGALNAVVYWSYLRRFMKRVRRSNHTPGHSHDMLPRIPAQRNHTVSYNVMFDLEADHAEESFLTLTSSQRETFASELPGHADWILGVGEEITALDLGDHRGIRNHGFGSSSRL